MRSSLTKTRNAGPTSTSKASAAPRALRSDARTPSRWFARVAKTRERLTCASRGMRSSPRASGGVGASRPTGRSAGTRAMHAARRRARSARAPGGTDTGRNTCVAKSPSTCGNERTRPPAVVARGGGAGRDSRETRGRFFDGDPRRGCPPSRGGGPRGDAASESSSPSLPYPASASIARERDPRRRPRAPPSERGPPRPPTRAPATSVAPGNSSAEPAESVLGAARAGSRVRRSQLSQLF